MAKLLQVVQLGHPVLRGKSRTVKRVSDKVVQELIDDMIATVMDVDGVGIAAPQVYEPLRIFIIASHPNKRYPHAPEMKPTAIINPKIEYRSETIVKDWEGCLSIPGIRGLVPRHKTIKVEYSDQKGARIEAEFDDFVARIFLHEYDHLEGKVFLDLINSKDIVTEKEYLKLMSEKISQSDS